MINCFASHDKVVRLQLEDDYADHWIAVKQELSVADQQQKLELAVHVDVNRQASEGERVVSATPRWDTSGCVDLAVAIVAWSFWDADGPVKLESTPEERARQFQGLKVEALDAMDAAYRKFRERQKEEKKIEATPTNAA